MSEPTKDLGFYIPKHQITELQFNDDRVSIRTVDGSVRHIIESGLEEYETMIEYMQNDTIIGIEVANNGLDITSHTSQNFAHNG